MIELSLSIHQLVDYLLRKGSIDTRIYNPETMQEGTRIHLRYQSIQNGTYESEVPLLWDEDFEEFTFHLMGRADGIIHDKNLTIVDEIKSTNDDLENFHEIQGEWHLGQAICYAYMYASINHLDEMGVRLTYISQIDNARVVKDYRFTYELLHKRVLELLSQYAKFYRTIVDLKEKRRESATDLEFPYPEFRQGQRDVAKYVYKVATDGGLFFFEAPTGTGKTISSLYPTILTFAKSKNDKVFYLSAKTQARTVAHDAMKVLTQKGLKAHSIVLYSKEQMCLMEERKCNPDDCPYAKNYYEKINSIVNSVLMDQTCIDKEIVMDYALANTVCPFECQLDISTFCDVIICDYNYFFDPIVYLKRFFDEAKTPYFALIDEAHNLSERTKEMYTIAIEEKKILDLQKAFKHFKLVGFKRQLKKVLLNLSALGDSVDEYQIFENDFPSSFYDMLETFFSSMQEVTKEHDEFVNEEFLDVFRMVNRFIKIHDYLNEYFVTYIERKEGFLNFYIRCLDSSELVSESLGKIRGAVFFSATLTPIDYYISTLGGKEDTPYLKLPSPFNKENLCLLVRSDISTRYKDREFSYKAIAESIKAVVNAKKGNYLVFFSSYQYLENVLKVYDASEENIIVQKKDMRMKDREEFLSHFVEDPSFTTVGFAVLGGVFSEGIDLVSSRLIGAVVVGVGLPMVSFERNLIKDYYDKKGMNGFDYSYTNPGKNKVMQAAGRVIRSASDKGVVLLIDERFLSRKYQDLFRLEWSHYKKVTSIDQIRNHLSLFWEEKD